MGSVILVSELRWAPDDVCRPFYRLIGKMWKFLISATSPGACKDAAAFPRQSFFQKFRRLASHIFTGTGNEIHNPVSIAVQKIILTE